MKSIERSILFAANLVNVVVQQFVNQIHMRQKHPSAAIAIESQFVQYFAYIYTLFRLAILIPLSDHQAELFPLVGDDLAAAETTNWNYHLLIIFIL